MIRASPAERYLTFLVAHPKGYTNEDIIAMCDETGISTLGNWYLNKLRRDLKLPTPFKPHDHTHKASFRWVCQRRLLKLFQNDRAANQAYAILRQARVKEFVETMILAHAPYDGIAAMLQRRGFKTSVAGISAYKFYFWDVDLLSSGDLRALLHFETTRTLTNPDPEIRAQSESIKKSFYNDPKRAAAELPFTPAAAMIAQMRLGSMPSVIDVARILDGARSVAAMRAFEAAYLNGPNDSMKFSDYTAGVERITKSLRDLVNPDDELREQLAAISLKTDTAQLPTLATLTAGKHTVDFLPAKVNDGSLDGDYDEPGSDGE